MFHKYVVCVCVCVGTLTAVESFLTASTGPEVCIFIMVCVIIHTGSCPISHAVCVCVGRVYPWRDVAVGGVRDGGQREAEKPEETIKPQTTACDRGQD